MDTILAVVIVLVLGFLVWQYMEGQEDKDDETSDYVQDVYRDRTSYLDGYRAGQASAGFWNNMKTVFVHPDRTVVKVRPRRFRRPRKMRPRVR